MMTDSTNSREIVLDALLEILEKGAYSHIVLFQALKKYQYLEKQERAFISRAVEGTIEYALLLDACIDRYASVKVKKMKPLVRCLLRMSVYQILYMDRVPDSAVCNEAVKLAKKRGFSGLAGFINGVLRTISREKENLVFEDASVRYSMPAWIVSMWEADYGQTTAAAMMESFLAKSRTAVRCNLNLISKEKIRESLTAQGVEVTETPLSDSILYLSGYDYLEGLDAFQKGYLQIQDMSSSFVGEIADPKEGDYVIDVCGAPGGKALHIADKLHGTGMVEARDLTWQKVALIEENIARTGFDNIRARVWDALVCDRDSVATADIVLADLPCSGLGVIGRKPDIKYRMTPEKIDELALLQRKILSVVSLYVKPGGKLIYSTCTIDRKENEENVRWFSETFPFDPINLDGKFGKELNAVTLKEGYLQLIPGIHPCDGFFLAAFQRR